ncbi:MAG: glycosyl transferase family 1 [Phycisphaerales bacterium]|nr:glycosyl transferase family 1 [Phycisphaerales bacterium]
MNVVIVNETLAYPPTAGNRIRTLNLMLRMARRHSITYICRSGEDSSVTREAQEFLADHGIHPIIADGCPPARTRIATHARLAANLFSPRPYAVVSHDSPAVHAVIRAYASSNPVDLWQFEWLPYVSALRNRPDARRLFMAHNVESLIWQRYHENESNPLRRWYIRQQWRKFERYEQDMFDVVDRVVAVSADDAALVRNRFGVSHVSVVDNGVDTDFFSQVTQARQPKLILFLGSLDWRPNLDALRLLLDHIFPAVLAREPTARLCIVGRNPPVWLTRRVRPGALGTDSRVELHADVSDVRPYLAHSAVMVAPLRIGGGSRLKILEAMAAGLPVVSTRIGCEGLTVQADRELIVADDVDDVSGALVRCIQEPASAAGMAERARQLVRSRYDWDTLADRLEEVWQHCATGHACRCVGPARCTACAAVQSSR